MITHYALASSGHDIDGVFWAVVVTPCKVPVDDPGTMYTSDQDKVTCAECRRRLGTDRNLYNVRLMRDGLEVPRAAV